MSSVKGHHVLVTTQRAITNLKDFLTDDHNKGSGDDFCLVFNIMGCIL
jgi:hypothetical protein